MTLTEFLLARIAEDEAAARAVTDEAWPGIKEISTGDDPWPSERAFAERFTIPRVLAECEAKRRIVERHSSEGWDFICEVEGGDCPNPDDCPDIRALALPYADHPDFRDEWRP